MRLRGNVLRQQHRRKRSTAVDVTVTVPTVRHTMATAMAGGIMGTTILRAVSSAATAAGAAWIDPPLSFGREVTIKKAHGVVRLFA